VEVSTVRGEKTPAWKTATRFGILLGIVLFVGGLILRDVQTQAFVRTGLVGEVLQFAGMVIALGCTAADYRVILTALSRKKTAEGVHTIVLALLAVVLTGLVCYISTRRYARLDWTGRRRFSLHSKTLRMLQHLEHPVKVTVVYEGFDQRALQVDPKARIQRWAYRRSREMLEEFQARSRRIAVKNLSMGNATELSALNQKYDLPGRCIIFESGESHDIIPLIEIVESAREQGGSPKFLGEAAFATALARVTQGRQRTVCFLTGHGEPPLKGPEYDKEDSEAPRSTERYSLSRLVSKLQDDNFACRPLNLADEGTVPEDCDVLVVAGPRTPLPPEQLLAIEHYLRQRRGRAIFMTDSRLQDEKGARSNLNEILNQYGIRAHTEAQGMRKAKALALGSGGLVTREQAIPQVPVTGEGYARHQITRDLRNYTMIFVTCAPLEITGGRPLPGLTTRELLTGTPTSWGETSTTPETEKATYDPGEDLPQPVTAAVVVEPGPSPQLSPSPEGQAPAPEGPKLVVFGSSESFVNYVAEQNEANLYVLLNAVNWLAGRGHMVGIPPKTMEISKVTLTDAQVRLSRWLFVLGGPACVVLLGIGVWQMRRR
jgi:hypothetical protein